MVESFFRHRCQIYKARRETAKASYGLPTSDVRIIYETAPTYDNLPCFFGNANNAPKITQAEPVHSFDGFNEVSLPANTNIKQGDKLVDLRFAIAYTVGFPEDVRGKYISVPIYRTAVQERL